MLTTVAFTAREGARPGRGKRREPHCRGTNPATLRLARAPSHPEAVEARWGGSVGARVWRRATGLRVAAGRADGGDVEGVRVNKAFRDLMSRRAADAVVDDGRVTINGEVRRAHCDGCIRRCSAAMLPPPTPYRKP